MDQSCSSVGGRMASRGKAEDDTLGLEQFPASVPEISSHEPGFGSMEIRLFVVYIVQLTKTGLRMDKRTRKGQERRSQGSHPQVQKEVDLGRKLE